ncbi:hypothetical protein EDB86DRAFT_2228052 [Lactarius hatsudake]|nr:hypothetical protein EDB86DRAFT_2228052 [Lactarius hatsudake]
MRGSLNGLRRCMQVARALLYTVDGATCLAGSWVPPSVGRAQRRSHSDSQVLFERTGGVDGRALVLCGPDDGVVLLNVPRFIYVSLSRSAHSPCHRLLYLWKHTVTLCRI